MKKHNSVFFLLFFVILFLLSWEVFSNNFVINPFTFGSLWSEKLLAIDLLKSGHFPFWNPYIANGTPLFANMQLSVLYPLNILFFIFNKNTAINIYMYLPFVMGFVFAYLFLNAVLTSKVSTVLGRAIGAIIFALIIFLVGRDGVGSFGQTIVWLPLILYFIEKYFKTGKYIFGCLMSICLIFSVFAGNSEMIAAVYLISGIYILLKVYFQQDHQAKSLGAQLSGFVFLSLLLGAIQIIPSIEMYQNSTREFFLNKFPPAISVNLSKPSSDLILKLKELSNDGRYYGNLPEYINTEYKLIGFSEGKDSKNANLTEIANALKNKNDLLGLLNFLSIKYYVDSDNNFRKTITEKNFGENYAKFDEKFPLLWTENNVRIYQNMDVSGSEKLAYSYVASSSEQELLQGLVNKNFDTLKTVFLEKNIGKLKEGRPGTITKISESETEKKYFVDGQLDGILVLSDIYYPGWRVYIDGEEQELLKVNNAFMGVKLREGKNNVQFIYNSNTIKLAVIMSFVGLYIWVFLTIFGIVEIWKKK